MEINPRTCPLGGDKPQKAKLKSQPIKIDKLWVDFGSKGQLHDSLSAWGSQPNSRQNEPQGEVPAPRESGCARALTA
jgi:hypothetical protein